MISLVVVGRNDNYAGNFLERLQTFCTTLFYLSTKYTLETELVIVDWNPPKDRPTLSEVLDTKGLNYVRIIEVSNLLHRGLPNSTKIPLFEFVAKNVGIRHTSGDYILVTNPDIILSERLVKELTITKLDPNYFYRAVRRDIKSPIPDFSTHKELETYCENNTIVINGYSSYKNTFSGKFDLSRLGYDTLDYLTRRVKLFPFTVPFTNASGDFFLTHRNNWSRLKGYPEIYDSDRTGLLHCDSLLVYQSIFLGLKQVILKGRIYHQEHERLARARNLSITSTKVDTIRSTLISLKKPLILNKEDWGLDGKV